MPYLRLTADRRGYENTFLMHVAAPGGPARILYWFRTAPGVRIGRAALDDAAMRWLEEQFPDIDFDWQDILDEGTVTPVEVEAPLPQRKRKPRPVDVADPSEFAPEDSAGVEEAPRVAPAESRALETPGDVADPPMASPSAGPDLLAELVGRGIAASLRQRFRAVRDAVDAAPADEAARDAWRQTLGPLDPDTWTTPEAILAGVASFEMATDAVKSQLDALPRDPEQG